MNKNIYRQYDSRWGNKAYPTKNSSFSGNGCGCCAVLHCIIERIKYRDYTPKDIIEYMKQFAVSGNGTLWSGIPAALKHYGLTNVKEFATMGDLYDAYKKDVKRVGVILFSAGSGPDGTIWTSGGHYVAFTDYKIKGKKHYFYMKDSGSRHHDGWYCYEESMKGKVFKIWSGVVPEDTKVEKINASIKDLSWAKGTAKSKYSYLKGKATSAFKKALDKFYPEHKNWGKAPSKGASCDVAVGVIMRHSGVCKDYPRGFDEQFKFNSKKFRTKSGERVTPYSIIKKLGTSGTYIVQYIKGKDSVHTLFYKNGALYEAQYEKTYLHRNASLKKIKTKWPKVRVIYFKW